MRYVTSDGNVVEKQSSWKEMLLNSIDVVFLFFRTLLNPSSVTTSNGRAIASSRSTGSSSSSSGSRGSGASGVRGFRTISDLPPPPFCGSCTGGGCG